MQQRSEFVANLEMQRDRANNARLLGEAARQRAIARRARYKPSWFQRFVQWCMK